MNILLFSPFSGIWEHSLPENIIAKALKQKIKTIDYLFCGGVLKNLCHCMEARQVRLTSSIKQKEAICNSCNKIANSYACDNTSQSFFLNDFLTTKDVNEVEEIIQNLTKSDCINLVYHNIPVGKIALYEAVLKFKKNNITIETDDEFDYLKTQLKNSLLVIHAGHNFLKNRTYDLVLIYSPQYAVNHTFSQIITSLKIETYFMEGGVNISNRLDTMRLWKWNQYKLVNPLISCWQEMKCYDIHSNEIHRVTKHFLELLKANSHMVFSPKFTSHKSIRTLFQIPSSKKILLATMSSFDEVYSAYLANLFPYNKAHSSVFENQIEWIKYLIDYASKNDDIFLIIRVHPRDFPNKRESSISDQGKKLLEIFGQGNQKYQINWPDQNISLYEMFDEVDVLLTGWSVTALEAAILGIPVVTYDKNLPSYPEDLMFSGNSIQEFNVNISKALFKGWSFDQVINAYHWLALNHCILSVPISNNFTDLISRSNSLIYRIIFKFFRIFNIDLRFKYFKANVIKNDPGLEAIMDVIEHLLPSNAHSQYFTGRKMLDHNSFQENIKNEFKILSSAYFKNYNKNVSYETLNQKINRFFNEKEKNCLSNRN